jgi:proteasome lid subunit RPN8/RPN11
MELRIKQIVLKEILSLAANNYPNEIILLLRGKKNNEALVVTDYLFPPFGVSGKGFASFRASMLPIDFSIIGTAHSHPSGSVKPSVGDYHNFYGRVMVIIGKPFKTSNVAAYSKQGDSIPIRIIE